MNLDELLWKRKSIRQFTDQEVSKEELETVIEAGRMAPFAGLVQAKVDDFRHFFVVKRGSETALKIMELVKAARLMDLKDIEASDLGERFPVYANVVKSNSNKEPVDLFLSPALVIVAERAGMPAREETVLGYIMAQMWLKATEMGIGMKLCSGVGDIRDKEALKNLLGLKPEENYAFDGCNLGYADGTLLREEMRPVPVKSITYLP